MTEKIQETEIKKTRLRLSERLKLVASFVPEGSRIAQRIIRKVLQNAGLTVIRNECSRITDSRRIQVCKDNKRKDNRPFPKGRGG